MKRALCLAGFALLLLTRADLRGDETPVAIRAGRLVDVRSSKIVERAVVIVRGTRIEAVGAGLAIPAGARVIDL